LIQSVSKWRVDEFGAKLEGCGDANGFDGDVDSETTSQLEHRSNGVVPAVVDHDVGAELPRLLEACVGEVDRDDLRRRVELRRHDRREPDRTGTNDGNRVARVDLAVEDPHFVGRGQDVREEQNLLVGQPIRNLVDRRVGERHPCVLGLQTVDQVPEDPSAATCAEPVMALLAEAAAAARRDARDEDTIALHERRDRGTCLHNRADGLVSEDRSRLHLGHVPFEDVEIGPTDGRRIDPHDRIGRREQRGIGCRLPVLSAGTVIDERFHG
jgi:hypothetical protein